MKFINKHRFLIIIVILAIILRLVYLSHTPYNVRTFDVLETGGHLDYIKYIFNSGTLPQVASGWEFHQPPFYYVISSFIFRIATFLSIDQLLVLQISSLIYFVIFLIFAYKILKITISNNKIILLSMICIAFWPSGIIHSIRIGNDVLFYALYAISLYFIQKYYLKNIRLDLFAAILFSSLTIATKSNGFALLIILGIVLLINILDKKEKFKKLIIPMLILFFGSIFGYLRNIVQVISRQTNDFLVGNTEQKINEGLKAGNNLINYISFDFLNYISYPFTSTWIDLYGRQNFWQFLIKSSLFSEFNFEGPLKYILAMLIAFLSLPFYLSIILKIFSFKKKELKKFLVLILNILSLTLLLLLFRIKEPYASNNDFRYIFPVIISLSLFASLWFEKIHSKKLWITLISNVFFLIPLLIAGLSVLFFFIWN